MTVRSALQPNLRQNLFRWLEHHLSDGDEPGGFWWWLLYRSAALPWIGKPILSMVADMHREAGRYPEAIDHYHAALVRSFDKQAGLHYGLGLALLKDGRLEGAEASLRRALDLAPQQEWPYGRLVECLLAQDRLDEAAPILTRGLELHPESEWLQAHLDSLIGRWRRRGNVAAALAMTKALHPIMGDRLERFDTAHPTRVGRTGKQIDRMIAAALAAGPGSETAAKALQWHMFWPHLATVERAEALERVVARHPRIEGAKILSALLLEGLCRYEASTARLREAAAQRWGAQAIAARSADASKPSVLIIGQAKAGTSALYAHLCDHPGFRPPLFKEPSYWNRRHESGPDWYAAVLPPLSPDSGTITGEASVDYLPSPVAPQRIAAQLPGIRLILLLRSSVERSYSHYWMDVRSGMQSISWQNHVETTMRTRPRCPVDERELLMGEFLSDCFLDSAALIHLQRWLTLFAREQLLILHHSDLLKQPQATLDRVCNFLDLPAMNVDVSRRVNDGGYPPMDSETEQRLRAWFAPHDRRLMQLLADLDALPMSSGR